MAEHLPRYHYQGLPTQDHIRIIVLEPGSGDDPIRCILRTVPLDEAGCQYEAISYVWGSPNNVTEIECDGQMISVTVSLASALRRFRFPIDQRIVWSDALSINQHNCDEKGFQVRRMGSIYEKARRVLCWLGPDHLAIAKGCFDLIREANRQIAQQWKNEWSSKNYHYDVYLSDLMSDKRDWHKFKDLLELPWFERAW
jgi:hypothetical protein